MADPTTCPPLLSSSIASARAKIRPYIHRTPVITSRSLNTIASSPDPKVFLSENPPTFEDAERSRNPETTPCFRLFFKCENFQKIGAFKARGAFHAVTRLVEEMGIQEVRRRGVVTHSSGTLSFSWCLFWPLLIRQCSLSSFRFFSCSSFSRSWGWSAASVVVCLRASWIMLRKLKETVHHVLWELLDAERGISMACVRHCSMNM